MAIPSPAGDEKFGVPYYYFRVEYNETQIKFLFFEFRLLPPYGKNEASFLSVGVMIQLPIYSPNALPLDVKFDHKKLELDD